MEHLPQADWVKVILCSATPQINDPNEIIPQINRGAGGQAGGREADVRTWSLERYREVFMGYVSFIRAGDTGVDIVYAGAPLPDEGSQYNVKSVSMSAFQEKTYNEVVKESARQWSRKGKGLRIKARQASLFVYPDGHAGGSLVRMNKRDVEIEATGQVPPSKKFGMGRYIKSDRGMTTGRRPSSARPRGRSRISGNSRPSTASSSTS